MNTKPTTTTVKHTQISSSDNGHFSSSENTGTACSSSVDPQVKTTKQKIFRRKFSLSDKQKFLDAYDALDETQSRCGPTPFSRYPLQEKNELKNRITGPGRNHSRAAMFELVLHELFLSMGATVTIHPPLESSQKKPATRKE